MAETNIFTQKHPFQFKIEGVFGFRKYIEDLIEKKHFDLAVEHIESIRVKYDLALIRNEIPTGKSFAYRHFQEYWKEQMDLALKGLTYPDGSRDKVNYELNQLKKEVASQKRSYSKKDKHSKTVIYYALWHFYQRDTNPITEENKDRLGKDYGFLNGDRLFLDYQTYSEQLNRLNNVKTKTTVKNRIKLLELVKKNLPPELQGKRIKDDLKALESRLIGIIESLR